MLIVNELKLNLDQDEKELRAQIKNKLRLKNEAFEYEIVRKSVDSRKEPYFNYQVKVNIANEKKYLKIKNVQEYHETDLKAKKINSDIRPIIIGYGPSGIFACVRLVEAGLKPIVFERGSRINKRKEDVEEFFNTGIFNKESNVVFGEGGAGTFSDAKLTTRIKDPFIDYIVDEFIKHGADPSIKTWAHPHVGSDKIIEVITSLTDDLISKGVEFHFDEEVKELIIKDDKVLGVKTSKGSYMSDYVLLGIGHSAYEFIKTINSQGVYVEKKDISIGFRVEHPQALINTIQYNGYSHPKLEASEYFLRFKGEKGVYSFCMCPGGFVIPSNHLEGTICTNGMSNHLRDNHLANSAILIQIPSDEFGQGNLSGFEYLSKLEHKAYNLDGSYKALACNIKDFVNHQLNPLIFTSSYPLGTKLCDYHKFFNKKDCDILIEAFKDFDKKIPGFIENGIMVGPETRSSSPVRIKRDETLNSISTKGLYPMGEGAGYGGGIMSCALDGIRIANQIITELSQ